MPQLDLNVFLTKRIRIHYSDSVTIITVKDFKFWQSKRGYSRPEILSESEKYILLQLFAELFDAEIFLRRVFPTSLQMLCKNQIKSPLLNQQLAAGAGERAGRGQERESFVQNAINHQLKLDIPLHLHI